MRQLLLVIPIGILGIVRWASWLIRRIPATLYRPYPPGHSEPVTVVTPVYQEDPEIFRAAVESWLANGVAEVIAVIDETDTVCIEVARTLPVTIIVTDVPGKRDALRRGWEAASTAIVALVDSDTIWADDVAARVVEPFADPRIGGVCPRQNVLNPRTMWQRINDFYLDYRYYDEVAGQTHWGRAVSCLSGRTAVYRREILLQISDDFMGEKFLGVPCNSGEDKRLTMLTLRAGYRTYMQQNARVWSTFPTGARSFFRQRLRWARNTWRSDLRSLKEGWVFRHKWLAFTMIDKALSAFTLLVAPVFLIIALVTGHFAIAGYLAIWWLLSRALKYLPHLERRPADALLLPAFVLTSFATAVLKIIALLTVRKQKWLTRDVAVIDGKLTRTAPGGGAAPAAGMARVRLNPGMIIAGLGAILGVIAVSSGLADAQQRPAATVVPGSALVAQATPTTGPARPTPVGNCLDPSDPPARGEENKLYNGTGDKRELQAYSPFRILQTNCIFSSDIRAITIDTTVVRLQAGGQVVREIVLPPGVGNPLDFAQLAALVGDPNWLAQVSPGVFEVKAAVVQRAGTRLTVAQPSVKELRLLDRPHVFLGGISATARYDGVTVTSWARDGSGPDLNYRDGRPFALYIRGSRFDIANSTFQYLGSDRAGAYGISWRLGGSTGVVQDSKFLNNYFGQFSYDADGIKYLRNEFRDNVFYGVDPHDRSRNLLFEGNLFQGNGSHGAIVSREVYDTTFRNNRAIGNGGNGIVIDSASFNVTVEGNEVRSNGLDGVVILHSRDSKIVDNVISDNRVGIRVNGSGSDGNLISGNQLEHNQKGIEAYGGATGLRIEQAKVTNSVIAGIALDAPRTRLVSVEISGSPVGLELRGPAEAASTTIHDVDVGVAVKAKERVTLQGVDVTARQIGVRVDRESAADLRDAQIAAPQPFKGSKAITKGDNLEITTSAPPGLPWFGVAGAAFLVAALILELLRRSRNRAHRARGQAPQMVNAIAAA